MRSSARAVSGSPPHRRGGPHEDGVQQGVHRINPALAGRTGAPACPAGGAPDHPRVGGEDITTPCMAVLANGSPPRRRGGRRHHLPRRLGVRITPATAGRTDARPRTCSRPADHPRDGGEDFLGMGLVALLGGSPPRRRGGRQLGGSTDAYGGSPPRRRGGPRRLSPRIRRGRITPASAGRTSAMRIRWAVLADHPRVGGEDWARSRIVSSGLGSPPRRRGGRARRIRRTPDDRITPASAGRTWTGPPTTPSPTDHPRVGREDRPLVEELGPRHGSPPRRRGGPDADPSRA